MLKPTLRNRVLYVRRLAPAGLLLFSVTLLLGLNTHFIQRVSASSSDTVNFQARLQNASGAIVPDGAYNIEFKLYNVSTGGTALWTEDYTAISGVGSTDVRVQVKDGYLSVALGSVTAFPGTIDWSQQLYLTMNIGGTGTTPSWDGEMNPRLAMTATPYSFLAKRATQADELSTTNGSYTSTLSVQGPTGGNQTFVIQDQGSSGSGPYYLLTTNQANANYVQLQPSSPTQQTGYLDISGSAIVGSVQTNTIDTASAGTISIGGTNATAITLGNGTSNIATTINGTALVKPTTGHDSTTAFQVQPAGSSTPVLNVDTTNTQVDIGTATGQATLTVQGTTNDSSANSLSVNDAGSNSLLRVRNDGQVMLGESANNTSEAVGHNTIGATPDAGFEQLVIATKITTGNLVPNLTSISAYVQATDTSPNNKYVLGIYTDNAGSPGSLIASSAQGTLTAGAWNTLPVSVGLAANTSYWLSFSTNTVSNTINFVPYDSTGTNTHAYMAGYVNAGINSPSTFTANSVGAGLDSIYATVTETGSLSTTLTVSPTNGVSIMTPTNSSTALQIQNSAGASIFDADTSGNSVSVGATGTEALASTINIATSSSATNVQAVNIGSESDASNSVSIQGGTGSSAVGVQAGTGGVISVGTANANTVNVGATGTTANTSTVNIANTTGNATQTINIGSTSSASNSVSIQGGTGSSAVGIQAGAGGTLSIGTANANIITIGNASSTNALTLQGSGITQTVTGAATNPSDVVQTTTNSTSAFKVVNNLGNSILNIDTTNSRVSLDGSAGTSAFNVKGTTLLGSVNSAGALSVLNSGGTSIFSVDTSGNKVSLTTQPATSGNQTISSPSLQLESAIWNGTASVASSYYLVNQASTSSPTYQLAFQNASNVDVLTLGPTGAATFQNTTNSGTAFRVKDTSNVSVINVDTTQDQITLNGVGHNNLVLNVAAAADENGILFQYTGAPGVSGEIGFAGGAGQIVNQSAANDLGIKSAYGNIYLAAGGSGAQVKVDTNGNVSLQNTTDSTSGFAFQVENTGSADLLAVSTGYNTVNVGAVGNTALTGTVNIATSTAGAQTAKIGSTYAGSATTIQGANGIALTGPNITIGSGSTGEATPDILVLDSESSGGTNPGEVDGAMFYNVGSRSFMCGIAGSWESCDGLLYSNTAASSAVSNCSTACGSLGQAAIPANYCQAGKVINLEAGGVYTTSAATLQFGLAYGSSSSSASDTLLGGSSGTLTQQSSSVTASGWTWQLRYTITCFSTTSMMIQGYEILQEAAAAQGSSMKVYALPISSPTTVTTTSANNIYIFPYFNTAAAGNNATLEQLVVTGY